MYNALRRSCTDRRSLYGAILADLLRADGVIRLPASLALLARVNGLLTILGIDIPLFMPSSMFKFQ